MRKAENFCIFSITRVLASIFEHIAGRVQKLLSLQVWWDTSLTEMFKLLAFFFNKRKNKLTGKVESDFFGGKDGSASLEIPVGDQVGRRLAFAVLEVLIDVILGVAHRKFVDSVL